MSGDIERSVDFYTSFCGLSVVRDRRREGGGTIWLGPQTLEGANPTFVMVIMEGEVSSRMDHLGFQCDSREQVDQIAERGRELGILVHPPTDSGGSVGYWTMLRDPDGHLVEFTYGQPLEGLH
jgi:catechol 2,3-dioxygenase-like lactoylglutathione lyase family enzyme